MKLIVSCVLYVYFICILLFYNELSLYNRVFVTREIKILTMLHNYNDDDVAMFSLLRLSEKYYNLAKKNVLSATTIEGNKNYKKLIFLSIKSLKIILKTYHQSLNPEIKALVLLKLSGIYYEETENYELAEKYLNGCFNVLKSHKMKRLEMIANILLIRILHQTDKNYCLIKLKNLIQSFANSPNHIAVFTILKLHYFKNHFEINQTTEFMIKQADDELKLYAFILLAHHYLDNNNLQKYRECFHLIDPVLEGLLVQGESTNYYKFKTMVFFLRFVEYYLTGNYKDLEKLLTAVPSFGSEAKSKWQVMDPQFTLQINVSDNLTQISIVDFDVEWICRDSFLSLIYVHMGVVLIYAKGLSRAISGANFQSKSLRAKFKYHSNGEKQTSDVPFNSSLQKFQRYNQRSLEIYQTTSFYSMWNNFLQNMKINVSSLIIENPKNEFEMKLSHKALYLDSLCLLESQSFKFEEVIDKLNSLADGPINDLTVYSALQVINLFNWHLDTIGKTLEKVNSIRKQILVRSNKLKKIIGEQAGPRNTFGDFFNSNVDLQSLVLSLDAIFELSDSMHNGPGKKLAKIERSKIRCFYSAVVAGLARAYLSENDSEFTLESKYISSLVNEVLNNEETPCPPCVQNGDFKHIAICAAETFHLHSKGVIDKREVNKRIKSSYENYLHGSGFHIANDYRSFMVPK